MVRAHFLSSHTTIMAFHMFVSVGPPIRPSTFCFPYLLLHLSIVRYPTWQWNSKPRYLTLDVKPDMLVEDLWRLVEEKTGKPHLLYYLIHSCKILEEGRKLSSYGIKYHAHIEQRFSPSRSRWYADLLRAKGEETART